MDKGLKQTISRAEEMIAIVPTSITTIVKSDLQRLINAAKRLDAVERERDGFEAWANTLESCGWHDAGECPYCTANDVRKSTDVLEPDVAKAVCYCGTCRRTWLETPAVRIVTVSSAVVLPADPGLAGKTHTQEGTAL